MLKWLALAFVLSAPVAACSEADAAFDCADICARYADCFGGDEFDESGCVDSCRDNADNSENFDQRVDQCENCLDDRSCTEAIGCSAECAGVIQ